MTSKPPPMNCSRACTPVCNNGTPACDIQNKQACDLTKQQVQSCEDAAYDRRPTESSTESFMDMSLSFIPLFVIGALSIIYGIISKN
jgi:hypothetical protein